MAEKRYFWLKVSKEFFEDKVIKKFRKLPGGDTYALIALRILLKALESEFKLYFDGVETSFAAELALDLGEQEAAVDVVVNAMVQYGWLQAVDKETIYAPKAEQMCGSEGSSASRVRKLREAKKVKALQCNADVTECNENVTLDIDKDIELDIDNSLHSLSSPEVSENEAIFIDIPVRGGKKVHISEAYCNEMQDLFQAIDVRAEIRKAKAWLLSNPKNAKSDWKRFIGSWLSRAQDKARPADRKSASKTDSSYFDGIETGEVRI